MNWALPAAILFMLGLVLLLGYFLSRKVFPGEEQGAHGAGSSKPSPCDGCSEAGCGGFARELVRGGSDAPGDAGKTGAARLGQEGCIQASVQPRERKAAIRCRGSRVPLRYRYSGAPSCQAAAAMAVRPKECSNACLGFGDCCRSCPPRAIRIEGDLARVDLDRCNGCGECVGACPVDLIALTPEEKGFEVLCKGPKGLSEDWSCPDGCTLCGRCIEACPESALETTETGMPRWIEDRCDGCGKCLEACPQDVVLVLNRLGGQAAASVSYRASSSRQ